MRHEFLLWHFKDKQAEAHKSLVTCSESHSWEFKTQVQL